MEDVEVLMKLPIASTAGLYKDASDSLEAVSRCDNGHVYDENYL